MVSVIIAAAGSGKRMGKSVNKVFLDLDGYPVLYHTILAFEKNPSVDEIILVMKDSEVEYFREKFSSYGFKKIVALVPGGAERMDSVRRGLERTDPRSEIVLIHDGARPFVTEELTDRVIENTVKYGACTPGVIPKDTVKVTDGEGFIFSSPERQKLRAVQTPQGFKGAELKRCYALAEDSGEIYTDDTSVYALGGSRVYICDGDYRNIKITTEEDILIAESFFKKIKNQSHFLTLI